MDEGVARAQRGPRRAEVPTGVQQVEEAEDPLELLPHGGAEAPLDGLLPRFGGGDLAEDLVRAVVAEDLGAEGGLQGAGVELDVGLLVADVDERDERPQAQGRVALEEVLREDGGGLRGADPLEHARDRAPDRGVAPRVGEGLARRAPGPRSPAATRAAAASSARGGRPSRPRRELANGAAPCRAAARIAVRATSSSSSSTSRRSASSNGRGSLSARRAASRRVRRPAAPSSATIDSKSGCAASRRSSPRRASTATTAARTEKSGKSPRSRRPRERVHVGVAREVEERLGPHLEVGIAQQRLDPRQDRPVARLVQDREGAAAHLGVRVARAGRAPRGGPRPRGGRPPSRRGRTGSPSGPPPRAGRRAPRSSPGRAPPSWRARRRGGAAAGSRAAWPRSAGAPARPGRSHRPMNGRVTRPRRTGPSPPSVAKAMHREAGEGVAGPPRHGVDERLRGELQPRGARAGRAAPPRAGRSSSAGPCPRP